MDIRLKRFLSLAIDWLFLFFVCAILVQILSLFLPTDYLIAFTVIIYVIAAFSYFTLVPMFYDGMTIGMSFFKLQIIRANGREVGFFGLLFRNLQMVYAVCIGMFFATMIDLQEQTNGHDMSNLPEEVQKVVDIISLQLQYVFTVFILVTIFFGASVLVFRNRGLHDFLGKTSVIELE